MARIGNRPTATTYILATRDYGREEVKTTALLDFNPAVRHILKDPMTVVGRFFGVSGKDARQERRCVSEVIAVLDAAKVGAKFVGTHAGRPVVGKRHKVMSTIEFMDVRSPYMSAL